jgi:hypothetical protein
MYGADRPEPAFNMHELVAHTAFAIAADSLFNCTDNMIASWSRKVRWALTDADPKNKRGVSILREWAALNESVPADQRGPLLQALFDLRTEHPISPASPVVRCAFSDRNPHSRMPLDPAHVHLKRTRVCPMAFLSGVHSRLPVGTVNCVQTLKAAKDFHDDFQILSLAMHDTTGATMTWCLMELARRPDFQAKVAAEARQVIAAKDAGNSTGDGASTKTRPPLTYEDLYKMPLLTKCINETLRLYPPVSYGSQRMLEEDEWLHCGPGTVFAVYHGFCHQP